MLKLTPSKISGGGGLKYEKEDIDLIEIPIKDIAQKIGNALIDAKTIIALQWYFLNPNTELKK